MIEPYASLSLTLLDVDEQAGEGTTLGAFASGRPLVLDFWHTRCKNCPDALSKLDGEAEKHPGVTFAACALSLGSETEGTQEQVLELLEGQWEQLTHLYMSFDQKELAKKLFGFKAVPFCVVFGSDGSLKYEGEPKGIDFKTVFDAPPVAQLAAELTAKASVAEDAATAKAAFPEAPQPVVEKKMAAAVEAAEPKPLAEANRAPPVALGFGNDEEDF